MFKRRAGPVIRPLQDSGDLISSQVDDVHGLIRPDPHLARIDIADQLLDAVKRSRGKLSADRMIADRIQAILLLRDDPRIIKAARLSLLVHRLRADVDVQIQRHRLHQLQVELALQVLAEGILQIARPGAGAVRIIAISDEQADHRFHVIQDAGRRDR